MITSFVGTPLWLCRSRRFETRKSGLQQYIISYLSLYREALPFTSHNGAHAYGAQLSSTYGKIPAHVSHPHTQIAVPGVEPRAHLWRSGHVIPRSIDPLRLISM